MEDKPKAKRRPPEWIADQGLDAIEAGVGAKFPRSLVMKLIWNVKHARALALSRLERLHKRESTAELMDRRLPCDVLAEGIVLGTVLLNPTLIDTLKLTVGHFLADEYKVIFETMLSMRKREIPIGVEHLREELKQSGAWESMGAAGGMADLMNMNVGPARFDEYTKRIDDCWRRRRMFWLAMEVIKAVHSDALTSDVISKTKATVGTL
jgi:hypothetical protein